MQDPTIFGREIAALAVQQLEAIGLSAGDPNAKQDRVRATSVTAIRSIQTAGDMIRRNGHSGEAADQWVREAMQAFSTALAEGRGNMAAAEAPSHEMRH